jgi:hypothetical protein
VFSSVSLEEEWDVNRAGSFMLTVVGWMGAGGLDGMNAFIIPIALNSHTVTLGFARP